MQDDLRRHDADVPRSRIWFRFVDRGRDMMNRLGDLEPKPVAQLGSRFLFGFIPVGCWL